MIRIKFFHIQYHRNWFLCIFDTQLNVTVGVAGPVYLAFFSLHNIVRQLWRAFVDRGQNQGWATRRKSQRAERIWHSFVKCLCYANCHAIPVCRGCGFVCAQYFTTHGWLLQVFSIKVALCYIFFKHVPNSASFLLNTLAESYVKWWLCTLATSSSARLNRKLL